MRSSCGNWTWRAARHSNSRRPRPCRFSRGYSPDGGRIAFVSTAGTGHFNLYVAELTSTGLGAPRAVIAPRESAISRYYYSTHDHTINPSWTPDGKSLVFVSNRENAYGTGPICSIALEAGGVPSCFINEETSWRANPEVAPDGKRVLYSSYQGRQWHQLWVTTLAGDATLPLTFGEFDVTQARWSPDGRRVAYISNESGNVALWIREFTGGVRKQIVAKTRKYSRPMSPLSIDLRDERGQPVSGRVSIRGSDARAYAPDDAWVSADDGFDPATQVEETRYFHCDGECVVTVPLGDTNVTAWRGQRYSAAQSTVQVQKGPAVTVGIRFKPLLLPSWAPASVSADLHVHMNYGGHYRSTSQTLAAQARAEDLDVIYNAIVNKEQRIPDIAYAGGGMTRDRGVTIFQAQEYPHQLLGTSRPARPARSFPYARFQRLSAERAHIAVSAQRRGGRPCSRARCARRLRASVRLGDRARK